MWNYRKYVFINHLPEGRMSGFAKIIIIYYTKCFYYNPQWRILVIKGILRLKMNYTKRRKACKCEGKGQLLYRQTQADDRLPKSKL